MFGYSLYNTPLNDHQRRMMSKHCRRCGISLPIISGNNMFCPKCKILNKKEQRLKYKLARLNAS